MSHTTPKTHRPPALRLTDALDKLYPEGPGPVCFQEVA